MTNILMTGTNKDINVGNGDSIDNYDDNPALKY